jgi:5'(3')-deoxyribonucleotidase
VAVVGVDLDDVLCNFTDAYALVCNKLFGRPDVGCQPIDWEWSNYHLTNEEKDAAWVVVKNTMNFWTTLAVEAGASPSMLQALDNKHTLVFITARVGSRGFAVQHQAALWLREKMGIEFPTVIVEYNKGPVASALKLDYFIDDRPKNCIEIQKAVPTCKVYLKDSSHNQQENNFVRVKDFNEFASIVLEDTK